MFVLRLAEALKKNKVDFVLVGGLAMALQGVVRATMDVDLVHRLSEEQFSRFEIVMKKLGLQSRLPVVAKEVFQFRKEYLEKRKMRAWSFVNPKNPAELVDVLIDRDSADLDFDVISVGGLKIRVVKSLFHDTLEARIFLTSEQELINQTADFLDHHQIDPKSDQGPL